MELAQHVLFFVLVLWPVSRYGGFSLLKVLRYFRAELILVLGTSSSDGVFPQLTAKLKKLGVDEPFVALGQLGLHSVLSAAVVVTDIAGNCVATLVVGKREKAVDRERLHAESDAGYQAA